MDNEPVRTSPHRSNPLAKLRLHQKDRWRRCLVANLPVQSGSGEKEFFLFFRVKKRDQPLSSLRVAFTQLRLGVWSLSLSQLSKESTRTHTHRPDHHAQHVLERHALFHQHHPGNGSRPEYPAWNNDVSRLPSTWLLRGKRDLVLLSACLVQVTSLPTNWTLNLQQNKI